MKHIETSWGSLMFPESTAESFQFLHESTQETLFIWADDHNPMIVIFKHNRISDKILFQIYQRSFNDLKYLNKNQLPSMHIIKSSEISPDLEANCLRTLSPPSTECFA